MPTVTCVRGSQDTRWFGVPLRVNGYDAIQDSQGRLEVLPAEDFQRDDAIKAPPEPVHDWLEHGKGHVGKRGVIPYCQPMEVHNPRPLCPLFEIW